MKTKSSHNWKTKSGTWDSLNLSLIDFNNDNISLSSLYKLDSCFNICICNNYKNITDNSLINMFVDDYILERFWNNPNKYINIFKKAKYVMTPDFSLYVDMPKVMQEWNIYRNRLVGYVWQKAGLNIIPTITWSDEKSFKFCFDNIEKNSNVAVSNIGCRNELMKHYFDAGFEEMKSIIKPTQIIFQCSRKYKECYTDKNIIFIDSFWNIKNLKKERS
jgi:hypothetical protein